MVVEHIYVLSLDEIKAIRFRCPKCRASASFRLTETVNFPASCPECRSTLYNRALDTGDEGVVHSLPMALKAIMELQSKNKSFEILLEIDAPRNQ